MHAPGDVVAGEGEERLGRRRDRRLGARIAGARVGGDERLRARGGSVSCRLQHGARRETGFEERALYHAAVKVSTAIGLTPSKRGRDRIGKVNVRAAPPRVVPAKRPRTWSGEREAGPMTTDIAIPRHP